MDAGKESLFFVIDAGIWNKDADAGNKSLFCVIDAGIWDVYVCFVGVIWIDSITVCVLECMVWIDYGGVDASTPGAEAGYVVMMFCFDIVFVSSVIAGQCSVIYMFKSTFQAQYMNTTLARTSQLSKPRMRVV